MRRIALIAIVLVVIIAIVLIWDESSVVPNSNATNATLANATPAATEDTAPATRTFTTGSVPDLADAYDFAATIPATWEAEAVSSIESLNLYDPAAPGDTNLDRSQIFIRTFIATDFQTLQTVTIKSRTEADVNGQPAVTYVIEKNPGVAPFPNQPSWRNVEHRVTDVRTTDDDVAVFLVIAQNPSLPDETFAAFLDSLALASFTPNAPTTPSADAPGTETTAPTLRVVEPVTPFWSRITKKSFGQYVTPATSPVQPERFSGYHTGVDLETTDEEQFTDVPVFAVADGTVVLRQTVSGYGGVIILEHVIDGETFTTLYGHIRLSSVTSGIDDTIAAGDQIAVLGTEGIETDGERKHLHFAVLKGSSRNLRGYVNSTSELSPWESPVDWLERFVQ